MINAALLGYALFGLHKKLLSRNKFVWAAVAFIATTILSQWVSFGYFSHPNITLFNALCGWLGASAVFLLFTLVEPFAIFSSTIGYSQRAERSATRSISCIR